MLQADIIQNNLFQENFTITTIKLKHNPALAYKPPPHYIPAPQFL
jgi:hypothetical protein